MLIPLIILFSIFFQIGIDLTEYLYPWSSKLWASRNFGAWERGARLSHWMDDERVDSILFLRDTIPLDTIVFIPDGLYAPFGWFSTMEASLFPRVTISCPADALPDCIPQGYSGELYIVRVEDYPTISNYELLGDYYPFTDDFGVIHLDLQRLKGP